MDQKEFCLKWNSYSDVFQGTFAALLRNEHFTDVTLSCESQTIKCHRVVLSACSAYFETLLLDAAHPHPIVILKDVRYRDMQALVKFMYTGEVTVAQAQINSLIKVADLLKIKGLADPDESSNSVKADREPLPERLSSTPPPHKRKRGETDPENNLFQDPLQDVVPSSKRVNSVPLAVATEQSSSSSSTIQVQPEETSASPLHVKEEIGDFTLEGGDDSSSQYEDQGDEFDYGTDTLVAGESGGGEPGPSTGLNPSGALPHQIPQLKRLKEGNEQHPGKREIKIAPARELKIAATLGLWHPQAKITLTTKVATVGLFGDTFHCSLNVLSVSPKASLARTADIPSLKNKDLRYYSAIGFLQFLREELGVFDVECYASMIFKVMPGVLVQSSIKAKNPFMNSCDDRFLTNVDMVKFLQHICSTTQVMTINKKSKNVLLKVLSTLLYSTILQESGTCTLNFAV